MFTVKGYESGARRISRNEMHIRREWMEDYLRAHNSLTTFADAAVAYEEWWKRQRSQRVAQLREVSSGH